MARVEIDARYKHPVKTAVQWTSANPVLLAGEVGYESDTGKSKVGDGVKTWNELEYTGMNKVDKVDGKGLSTEDYTTVEKAKLAGIAAGANNYTHPSTHPVDMITGLGTAATKDVGKSAGNVVGVNPDGKIDSTLIGGGHADTADKLKTPRSIALSGGATGTATNFDGSSNISIPVTGLDASKLTSGIVPTARLSPDPGAYTINPKMGSSGVLYASLDRPTLAEIGAVDETFTNKLAFYPYENALCEISSDDGATWTPDPGMAEAKWKALVSENNNADISFTSNKQYRITLTAKDYCYLSAVYFYASVASKVGLAIKVEKWSNDAASWSVVTPQTNTNGAQPNHFWLQHANVPFNPKTGNSVYCGKVRITFIPSESDNATGSVNLYGLRWYGGYPGTDHRTIYSWDGDKNVTFPAQLKASEVYDNSQRVYSPVNKPSAADLGAATISHTHNLATTAESGYMSGADKTKLEATNVAYGTCATEAATAAKIVTLSGNTNWKLVPGSTVTVKFTYTNTASNPTLNVAGTGAKPIWVNTAVITTSNLAYAGSASRPIKYVYDGTQYVCMGWSGDNNSTYALMTAAEATTGTATNAKLISAKVLNDKIKEMLPTLSSLGVTATTAELNYVDGVTSNIQTQLNGKAASSHTHSAATTSAAGFMSAADKTKLNGISAGASNYESQLGWGNTNISGGPSPVDAAASSLHSANRLQFANPAGITVEYSRDDGATWLDYGLSDSNKIALVSGHGSALFVGGHNSGVTIKDKVRVTLDATTMGVHTRCQKVLLNISTSGASGSNVTIEKSMKGSTTTFTNVTSSNLSGWSGWNSLYVPCTFGGDDTQTNNVAKLRFTFGITGLSSNTSRNNALTLLDMVMIGDTYWRYPSAMAKTGHLYTFDTAQNATFPANVTATSFTGALSGNATSATTATTATTANKTKAALTAGSKTFNGSAAVTLTAADVGAAAASHTHKAVYTATLTAAGWSASAPYTQTVSVSGITASDTPIADVVLSSTAATAISQQDAWGCVSKITTAANSITATCLEEKPTINIPIRLMAIR